MLKLHLEVFERTLLHAPSAQMLHLDVLNVQQEQAARLFKLLRKVVGFGMEVGVRDNACEMQA